MLRNGFDDDILCEHELNHSHVTKYLKRLALNKDLGPSGYLDLSHPHRAI